MPGAFKLAAEALEVSTQKLNDMLENGEVLATDLLPRLAVVLEEKFGSAAVGAAGRAQAKFNLFRNAVIEFQRALATSGILEYLTKAAEKGTILVKGINRALGFETQEDQVTRLRQEIDNIQKSISKMSKEGYSKEYLSRYQSAIDMRKQEIKLIMSDVLTRERLDRQRQQDINRNIREIKEAEALEKKTSKAKIGRIQRDERLITKSTSKTFSEYKKLLKEQEEMDIKIGKAYLFPEAVKPGKQALGPLAEYIEFLNESINKTDALENIVADSFQAMEDSLVEFVKTGKLNFSDLIDSMISDIIRFQIRSAIIAPLTGALSGFLSGFLPGATPTPGSFTGEPEVDLAKGGVLSGSSINQFSNSIVSSPTTVPATYHAFAKGGALFGEAGPEAIMPLTRTSTGELGVKSTGNGGRDVEINIYNAPEGTETRRTDTGTGERIDIFLDKTMAQVIGRGGKTDNILKAKYGLSPVLAGR